MIDPPDVPERKSYPPRMQIIFVGTVLSMGIAVLWVFARTLWGETDPQDPQKMLATEVYKAAKAHFAWPSQNGFGLGAASRRVWTLLHRRELNRAE